MNNGPKLDRYVTRYGVNQILEDTRLRGEVVQQAEEKGIPQDEVKAKINATNWQLIEVSQI